VRVELGKHVNTIDAGVDAITDGDINEPIFSGNWNGRFRAKFIQWIEARTAPPRKDEGQYFIQARHSYSSGFIEMAEAGSTLFYRICP
jgi:hypothetical protein